jgi:invasion protein IalB
VGAAAAFGVVELLVAAAPSVTVQLVALAALGAVAVTFAAGVNSALQLAVAPEMRGRVMALYSVVFTAEDRPNVGLTVVFYEAIGENKKLLRVVVPLGVLLPTGLGLKIDDQDVGNAPFLKCGKRGCVAEVVLQDEVIAKLKQGTNAMFIIFDTPEAGIGIPVSLQGFTDAFASLK